jgi:predicted transcriptional regulator
MSENTGYMTTFTLNLPTTLMDRVRASAELNERSTTGEIRRAIALYLKAQEAAPDERAVTL